MSNFQPLIMVFYSIQLTVFHSDYGSGVLWNSLYITLDGHQLLWSDWLYSEKKFLCTQNLTIVQYTLDCLKTCIILYICCIYRRLRRVWCVRLKLSHVCISINLWSSSSIFCDDDKVVVACSALHSSVQLT